MGGAFFLYRPALTVNLLPMADTPHTLGIIAGNRTLPRILAREARAAGVQQLVAAAFTDETEPELAELVDVIEWLRVGQLNKLVEVFQKNNVTQCVMVGQIAPKNLFDLRPDLRAVKLLASLPEKNAHSLFGGIADELAKDGITLIEATPWLKPAMPEAGFQFGPEPTDDVRADIEYGLRIARETSRLEIGQTVVVKNGTVLAVEGLEGTDACLTRGGELAEGAVAVKSPKPGHDLRFDIPCLGAQTLETCASANIRALAFEAGRTLLLDESEVDALAQRHGITLTAV